MGFLAVMGMFSTKHYATQTYYEFCVTQEWFGGSWPTNGSYIRTLVCNWPQPFFLRGASRPPHLALDEAIKQIASLISK